MVINGNKLLKSNLGYLLPSVQHDSYNVIHKNLFPHSHQSFNGWLRCTVVERRSLAGELSLSHARPAADG